MRVSVLLACVAGCTGSIGDPIERDISADAAGGSAAIDAAPPGDRITCPMPLVSRDRPITVSRGDGRGLADGALAGFTWTGSDGDWAAIDVGIGASQVMVAWTASGAAAPRAYVVETSADSTTGADGTWTAAATIAGSSAPTRAHVIPFAGRRWLRVRLGGDATLAELAVHDASAGACDSWLFLGDSITALAFNLSTDFSDDVHAARGGTYPLRLAIGVGGTNSQDGLDHVEEWLATYPDVTNWVVSYGTNDMGGGDPAYAPAFGERMRALVDRLHRAGKRVLVPRIPYGKWDPDGAVIPIYNAQIDRLVADGLVLAGPDLYAHFRAHPEQLGDDIHPNGDGAAAMNRLWAEAVLPLYP